jgi:hypothetical protein
MLGYLPILIFIELLHQHRKRTFWNATPQPIPQLGNADLAAIIVVQHFKSCLQLFLSEAGLDVHCCHQKLRVVDVTGLVFVDVVEHRVEFVYVRYSLFAIGTLEGLFHLLAADHAVAVGVDLPEGLHHFLALLVRGQEVYDEDQYPFLDFL